MTNKEETTMEVELEERTYLTVTIGDRVWNLPADENTVSCIKALIGKVNKND